MRIEQPGQFSYVHFFQIIIRAAFSDVVIDNLLPLCHTAVHLCVQSSVYKPCKETAVVSECSYFIENCLYWQSEEKVFFVFLERQDSLNRIDITVICIHFQRSIGG